MFEQALATTLIFLGTFLTFICFAFSTNKLVQNIKDLLAMFTLLGIVFVSGYGIKTLMLIVWKVLTI